MFQNNNFFFIIIASIVLLLVLLFGYRNESKSKTKKILWQLILAGGISNIIDRVARGYVVDFIALKLFRSF